MSFFAHPKHPPKASYRHAALLYAGEDGFFEGTVPFIRAAIDAEAPTLVVLPRQKIERLRAALGGETAGIEFADMQQVGSNPARILPAWQRFVGAHPGRSLRGIGEPIFPERGAAELRECQHHERLLNPALEGSSLSLLCPYDTEAMGAEVIEEARRSHPILEQGGVECESDQFLGADVAKGLLHEPLPEAPPAVRSFRDVGITDLMIARRLVQAEAARAGLPRGRQMDLALAVNEALTNSIRHANRPATVSLWCDGSTFVAEVSGGGQIEDAMVDRTATSPEEVGGRGLWLTNQICDLVQLRALPEGVVVRMHIHGCSQPSRAEPLRKRGHDAPTQSDRQTAAIGSLG